MDKYIAFYAANCESETFETFEAAKKWLMDGYDIENGYSEETMRGFDYIAKITHRSKFIETEKEKHHWKYEEGNNKCPYDNEFDIAGNIILEDVDA